MAVDRRAEIFGLREQGVSIRGIAAELGLSAGKVQRELAKRADVHRGVGAAVEIPSTPNPVEQLFGADPELAERQRAIQRKRLALQESDLELRGLEQQQRLALMRGGSQGNDGGQMAAFVLAEVGRLRDEIRDRPAKDPASLVDQLEQLSKLGRTVASFAPPTPPSSPAEVEFKVALARIDLEAQRIAKDREQEIALRAQQVASENMRNDAIARFIESFGPMLSQVAQKWLEDKNPRPAAAPALPAAAATQPAAIEIEGTCPRCAAGIAMSDGSSEKCPACGAMLVAAAGQITLADAAQNGHGPNPQPVQTFAS